MIGASVYIILCTARNRIRVRLRRLREPRYLIGAIVGVAYIYFSFFARFRSQRSSAERRRRRGAPVTPAVFATLAATGPAITGLGLMVITALAWILPVDSGLLDFSSAEVQFLFPAPVTRRSLLMHRLLRSQIGILFGSLVVGLVTPSLAGYTRLQIGVGMWLLLCTGKVYYTGISLARARLASSDRRARRMAWLPLLVMASALAIVGAALAQAVMAQPIAGPRDALNRVAQVSSSGLSRVVMWPFVALASPMFAQWPGPFFTALATALLVLVAVTAWVLKSDEMFEEATEQAARAKAQAKQSAPQYRMRSSSAWQLATAGRPEGAFVWKAATQTFRVVDMRLLLRLVPMIVALGIAAASMSRETGIAGVIALFGLAGTAFAVLLGPQAIRIDMRQDLQHLESIKTWPVRAADVVRGELLWPGALVTGLAWTMIVAATAFSGALFGGTGAALRFSLGAAAFVLAPGLAFAQLAIHNGAALIFPAWIPLGHQRPRGLDAMGQRIIMLGGTWLALIVMAIPGAIAGGIVWFAARLLVGPLAMVAGAATCTGILLIEVLVITEMLAPAYERLDILAVERSE